MFLPWVLSWFVPAHCTATRVLCDGQSGSTIQTQRYHGLALSSLKRSDPFSYLLHCCGLANLLLVFLWWCSHLDPPKFTQELGIFRKGRTSWVIGASQVITRVLSHGVFNGQKSLSDSLSLPVLLRGHCCKASPYPWHAWCDYISITTGTGCSLVSVHSGTCTGNDRTYSVHVHVHVSLSVLKASIKVVDMTPLYHDLQTLAAVYFNRNMH